MMSKRRPILFEVLGERGATPRRTASASSAALIFSDGRAAGFVGIILVVGVLLAGVMYYKLSGRGNPAHPGGAAPLLQTNAVATGDGGNSAPAEAAKGPHAVVVQVLAYRSPSEKAKMRTRAQETLDYLGSLSDPDFRDARAVAVPAGDKADRNRGMYCIYVGSAEKRGDLAGLTEKVKKLQFPRGRTPFSGAYAALVEKP